MAEIEKIRVFVSSRSQVDVFSPPERLTTVRTKLQAYLQSVRWSVAGETVGRDEPVFDVWIHEQETGVAADRSTLDLSLDEVDRADVVLVLYDGQAGSTAAGAQMGICHAELHQALERRRDIVFLVRLVPLCATVTPHDQAFRSYVDSLSLYQKDASNQDELHGVAAEMLQNTVARLAVRGSNTATRKLDRGQALQWNSLNLAERQAQMRMALAEDLGVEPVSPQGRPEVKQPPRGEATRSAVERGGHVLPQLDPTLFEWTLPGGAAMLARLDAMPAAASQPAAREMVGQPFLRDHLLAPLLQSHDLLGPIHIIACHRSITESQVTKMLGNTDCMVVASDFGIYATDHVQKIQLVFLAKCSDATATGLVVRRFLEWLDQSGEGRRMALRAASRQRILAAVAAEQLAPASAAARKSVLGKRRSS